MINFHQELVAHFGLPEMIVSENGTQFTGSNFKNFCSSLVIEHIPYCTIQDQMG